MRVGVDWPATKVVPGVEVASVAVLVILYKRHNTQMDHTSATHEVEDVEAGVLESVFDGVEEGVEEEAVTPEAGSLEGVAEGVF